MAKPTLLVAQRDFDEKPYSADETRVAEWFCSKGIGGGDDPIGALISLHEFAMFELRKMREQHDAKTDVKIGG